MLRQPRISQYIHILHSNGYEIDKIWNGSPTEVGVGIVKEGEFQVLVVGEPFPGAFNDYEGILIEVFKLLLLQLPE